MLAFKKLRTSSYYFYQIVEDKFVFVGKGSNIAVAVGVSIFKDDFNLVI